MFISLSNKIIYTPEEINKFIQEEEFKTIEQIKAEDKMREFLHQLEWEQLKYSID